MWFGQLPWNLVYFGQHEIHWTELRMNAYACNYITIRVHSRKKNWRQITTAILLTARFFFFVWPLLHTDFMYNNYIYAPAHAMAHCHSVWLPWTRDRSVAKTYTCTALNIHKRRTNHTPGGIQSRSPSKRAALDRAATGIGHNKMYCRVNLAV
jgi:hypothetical protein